MQAFVEVIRPDGSRARHRIDGEQATLGRSPTAGVPLVNADDLLPEHLLLAPRAEGCWVAVADGAQPVALVGGHPVSGQVVPWGTEIELGKSRIRITDKPPKLSAREDKRVTSPVMLVAFIAIPFVGWMLLSDSEAELPSGPGSDPPELYTLTDECPENGDPETQAIDAAEAASARSDRYPFDAQDGVQAVNLYSIAAACYARAGRNGDANRLRRERDRLTRRIDEDYRTGRLRLERALEYQRYDEAIAEAQALLALLRHLPDHEYTVWLTLLERNLQLMLDQQITG
ncbi:MAG: FHA domain-containing protein [Myxococcota bacterium]